MENVDKHDRRKITSPLNGAKGGRPRIWNVNPYEIIKHCRQNPTPENLRTMQEVECKLKMRRKAHQKRELAKYHKRPDLALKQIQTQKDLRKKKLAELRYLRMVVRRLMIQLEGMDTVDLDYIRNTKPKK